MNRVPFAAMIAFCGALGCALGAVWLGETIGTAIVATLVCFVGLYLRMRQKVAALGQPPNASVRDYVLARKASATASQGGH